MTNPTEPRWIPAAEKEGGLVFGDVVRMPNVKAGTKAYENLVFLRHFHDSGLQWSKIANNYGDVFNHPEDDGDLLVRIEPLPVATFERVGVNAPMPVGWAPVSEYDRTSYALGRCNSTGEIVGIFPDTCIVGHVIARSLYSGVKLQLKEGDVSVLTQLPESTDAFRRGQQNIVDLVDASRTHYRKMADQTVDHPGRQADHEFFENGYAVLDALLHKIEKNTGSTPTESTEAFRRGIEWSIDLLKRYVRNEGVVSDEDAGFRDALEYLTLNAREHGITPTEAADGE